MTQDSEEFWNSPNGRAALERIIERGTEYWRQNVYRYYRLGTGQLGDACDIHLEGNSVVVSLKPIYNIQRNGTIHEYGQDVMTGIPAGTGKYSPVRGYRLDTGYYPGVSVNKFWEPWMAEFEPVLLDIVREEVISSVRDFTREQLEGMYSEYNVH